jgi:hypothetical protein
MQQALCEADTARRIGLGGDFEAFFEDNPAVPRTIWSSDEECFNLNAEVNICVSASEHPHKWKC